MGGRRRSRNVKIGVWGGTGDLERSLAVESRESAAKFEGERGDFRRVGGSQSSVRRDGVRRERSGQRVDEPGTANASSRFVADRSRAPKGSVGGKVDGADRAWNGERTASDLGSFERRAGGGRSREKTAVSR